LYLINRISYGSPFRFSPHKKKDLSSSCRAQVLSFLRPTMLLFLERNVCEIVVYLDSLVFRTEEPDSINGDFVAGSERAVFAWIH
jgi:hypothetical protein